MTTPTTTQTRSNERGKSHPGDLPLQGYRQDSTLEKNDSNWIENIVCRYASKRTAKHCNQYVECTIAMVSGQERTLPAFHLRYACSHDDPKFGSLA